jgi:hypothetical protein
MDLTPRETRRCCADGCEDNPSEVDVDERECRVLVELGREGEADVEPIGGAFDAVQPEPRVQQPVLHHVPGTRQRDAQLGELVGPFGMLALERLDLHPSRRQRVAQVVAEHIHERAASLLEPRDVLLEQRRRPHEHRDRQPEQEHGLRQGHVEGLAELPTVPVAATAARTRRPARAATAVTGSSMRRLRGNPPPITISAAARRPVRCKRFSGHARGAGSREPRGGKAPV